MLPPASLAASQHPDCNSATLAMAIQRGDIAMVGDLVRRGATLPEPYHCAKCQACLFGPDMMRTLLVSPAIRSNISIPDDNGDCILHFVLRTPATGNPKMQIVSILLEHGAEVHQPDRLGETVLHILARMPDAEEARLLPVLLANCDPLPILNHQNNHGDTALIVAVIRDHYEAASLLLNFGADPNIAGEDGNLAAEYALRMGKMEMLALLQRFGGKIGEWLAVE